MGTRMMCLFTRVGRYFEATFKLVRGVETFGIKEEMEIESNWIFLDKIGKHEMKLRLPPLTFARTRIRLPYVTWL